MSLEKAISLYKGTNMEAPIAIGLRARIKTSAGDSYECSILNCDCCDADCE